MTGTSCWDEQREAVELFGFIASDPLAPRARARWRSRWRFSDAGKKKRHAGTRPAWRIVFRDVRLEHQLEADAHFARRLPHTVLQEARIAKDVVRGDLPLGIEAREEVFEATDRKVRAGLDAERVRGLRLVEQVQDVEDELAGESAGQFDVLDEAEVRHGQPWRAAIAAAALVEHRQRALHVYLARDRDAARRPEHRAHRGAGGHDIGAAELQLMRALGVQVAIDRFAARRVRHYQAVEQAGHVR